MRLASSLVAPGLGLLVLMAACGGSPFTVSTDAGAGGSSGGGSGAGSSSGGSGGSSGGSGSGGSSGGSGASSSGGSSGGASSGGGGLDASADGPIGVGDGGVADGGGCMFPATRCGQMTCDGTGGQQGSLCCVSPSQTPAFSCASCSCGCTTQLECAASAECGGTKVCCIQQDSCGGGGQHMVSRCTSIGGCNAGQRLCNPSGGNALLECGSATATCSPDTISVGIPSNTGYGVCM